MTTSNDGNSKSKWSNPVDVVCNGCLTTFPTRRVARDFFFEGICETEGSEQARYAEIFIDLEETDARMVSNEKNPCVYRIADFLGDRIGDTKRLDEPIMYDNYIRDIDSIVTEIPETNTAAANTSPPQQKPQAKEFHEPEM